MTCELDETAVRFLRGEITWDEAVAEKRGYREFERGSTKMPLHPAILRACRQLGV